MEIKGKINKLNSSIIDKIKETKGVTDIVIHNKESLISFNLYKDEIIIDYKSKDLISVYLVVIKDKLTKATVKYIFDKEKFDYNFSVIKNNTNEMIINKAFITYVNHSGYSFMNRVNASIAYSIISDLEFSIEMLNKMEFKNLIKIFMNNDIYNRKNIYRSEKLTNLLMLYMSLFMNSTYDIDVLLNKVSILFGHRMKLLIDKVLKLDRNGVVTLTNVIDWKNGQGSNQNINSNRV